MATQTFDILIIGLSAIGVLTCLAFLWRAGQQQSCKAARSGADKGSSLDNITSGGMELNYVAQPSPIVDRRGQVIQDVVAEQQDWAKKTRALPDSKAVSKLYWA